MTEVCDTVRISKKISNKLAFIHGSFNASPEEMSLMYLDPRMRRWVLCFQKGQYKDRLVRNIKEEIKIELQLQVHDKEVDDSSANNEVQNLFYEDQILD